MAVRRAREARGWSQTALGNLLQRHLNLNVGGQSGIARIEAGERPTRLNEVVAISRYLDLDLQAVLTGALHRLSEAEELEVALVQARARLEAAEAEVEAAHLDAVAAQANADLAAQRHAELRGRLASLRDVHDQLLASLLQAADARRRLELLKDSDGE